MNGDAAAGTRAGTAMAVAVTRAAAVGAVAVGLFRLIAFAAKWNEWLHVTRKSDREEEEGTR